MTLSEFKRALARAVYVAAVTRSGAYVAINKAEASRYAGMDGATAIACGQWVIVGGDTSDFEKIDNAAASANVANT